MNSVYEVRADVLSFLKSLFFNHPSLLIYETLCFFFFVYLIKYAILFYTKLDPNYLYETSFILTFCINFFLCLVNSFAFTIFYLIRYFKYGTTFLSTEMLSMFNITVFVLSFVIILILTFLIYVLIEHDVKLLFFATSILFIVNLILIFTTFSFKENIILRLITPAACLIADLVCLVYLKTFIPD